MKVNIEWATPPDRSHYEVPSHKFAAALRTQPGEWALYKGKYAKSSAGSVAQYIKRGWWAPGAGYEATVRGGLVYVRYVGEEADRG